MLLDKPNALLVISNTVINATKVMTHALNAYHLESYSMV
jgi:hypothetical protein